MTKEKYRKGFQGICPYFYKKTRTSSLNREAFVNTYTLYTDDWFESGTRFAYSLHKTSEDARKYESHRWWAPNYIKGELVYVSKKTLEAITKEPRTKRGKGLFVSMED